MGRCWTGSTRHPFISFSERDYCSGVLIWLAPYKILNEKMDAVASTQDAASNRVSR